MKYGKHLLVAAGVLFAAGCNKESQSGAGYGGDHQSSSSAVVRSSGADTSSVPAAADNTGVNVRDRSGNTLTPGDQGTNDSDRQVTDRIRRALNANDQLSADAKNIKVITVNGKVTLRGPVKSQEERTTINSLAQQNGATSVDNQLEVADQK